MVKARCTALANHSLECRLILQYNGFLSVFAIFFLDFSSHPKKNHILSCRSDLAGPLWTQIGITKQLDPKNKSVTAFLKFLKIDLTWRGQMSKFDLILPQNQILACCSDPSGGQKLAE